MERVWTCDSRNMTFNPFFFRTIRDDQELSFFLRFLRRPFRSGYERGTLPFLGVRRRHRYRRPLKGWVGTRDQTPHPRTPGRKRYSGLPLYDGPSTLRGGHECGRPSSRFTSRTVKVLSLFRPKVTSGTKDLGDKGRFSGDKKWKFWI